MPASPSGPVRRGQLIAPFGVGSLVVVPGGTSLIVGGLDYWYKNDKEKENDIQEFMIEEWRLQDYLKVDHLRLPPDFREPKWGQEVPNIGMTIPSFRFPTWHFCSDKDCRLLIQRPPLQRGVRGRIKCPECAKKKKTRYLFQVPFVAMCENGHIQDFPWREWVHSQADPNCDGVLRLYSTGSATLAGQKVYCEGCKKERTLSGITGADTLTKSLDPNKDFTCQGNKPWLGPDFRESCNSPTRGSLRSASNLYYAKIVSSIYLPRLASTDLQEIEERLNSFPISDLISTLNDLGVTDPAKVAVILKKNHSRLLSEFKETQIIEVLERIKEQTGDSKQSDQPDKNQDSLSIKKAEYEALRTKRDDLLLKIAEGNLDDYDQEIAKYFSRIMLVRKLRETRALVGFTRVFPENDKSWLKLQEVLWKKMPSVPEERWLPAYIVFGEGIFLEFKEELLREWEKENKAVEKRLFPLVKRSRIMVEDNKLQDREVSPRFILIHTFAHLIMNQLIFECGYSSAALRERLYFSNDPEFPMAGVLIYTADGDSEGTMGGLVRMGKPGYIEPVISRALANAKWCSADHVCMEMGKNNGQGPDSCNLAACHNCALVPETACEEFNRFLDRGVVVGELDNPDLGFFSI